MNRDNHPTYYFDGRCTHCGDMCNTFGCARCKQVQTFCTCGALLLCGCGRSFTHENCPNIIQTSFMRLTATYEIIPNTIQPIGDGVTRSYLTIPSTTAPSPVHFQRSLVMPDFDQQRLTWPPSHHPPVFQLCL